MSELALASKVTAGIRRFLEKAPSGSQHLRLVARSDPPMTLLSFTAEEVQKSASTTWADLSEQMADHAATTGLTHYLVAWVGDHDGVLASRPLIHELPERPVMGQSGGAQQLALQLDGSMTSQLAQMQKLTYDMSKLFMQGQTAQMAQAISLLDKYSERAITAIEHETRMSRENAELRAEIAELSAKLENMVIESTPETVADTQSAILDMLKPAMPMIVARIMAALPALPAPPAAELPKQ